MIVIAVVGVLGAYLTTFGVNLPGQGDGGGGRFGGDFDDLQWGQFLLSSVSSLGFAGLVFAAGFLIDVIASRLDVEIVASDESLAAEP